MGRAIGARLDWTNGILFVLRSDAWPSSLRKSCIRFLIPVFSIQTTICIDVSKSVKYDVSASAGTNMGDNIVFGLGILRLVSKRPGSLLLIRFAWIGPVTDELA